MKVECRVEECFEYHDMENAEINHYFNSLAKRFEYKFRLRQTFCSCKINNYVISLQANKSLKLKARVLVGCIHFEEEFIKVVYL